jgi:hypothetical protein
VIVAGREIPLIQDEHGRPVRLPDDPELMRELIETLLKRLSDAQVENQKLRGELDSLKRGLWGRKSEKLDASQLVMFAELLAQRGVAMPEAGLPEEEAKPQPPRNGFAVVQQHPDAVATRWGHGEVQVRVAVQVAHRHGPRPVAGAVGNVRRKRAVAVVQQHRDAAVGITLTVAVVISAVGPGEVQVRVAIQVAHRQRPRVAVSAVNRRPERAVAIQQHYYKTLSPDWPLATARSRSESPSRSPTATEKPPAP